MSSPIAIREFDPDEYRRFVQTLSDEELVKAGKRLRSLSGEIVLTTPSTFQRQSKGSVENGALGAIRTPDLVLRRHTLYPAELRARRNGALPIHCNAKRQRLPWWRISVSPWHVP